MERLRSSFLSKTTSESDISEGECTVCVLEIISNHGIPSEVGYGGIVVLDGHYRELKLAGARVIGTNDRASVGPWKYRWPPQNGRNRVGIRFTSRSEEKPAILRIWPNDDKAASVKEVVLYINDVAFCRREVRNVLPVSISLKQPDAGINESFYDENRAALARMWRSGVPFVGTRVMTVHFIECEGSSVSLSFIRLWDADGNVIEARRTAKVSVSGITSQMDPRYAFLEVKPKHFDENGTLLEDYEFTFEHENMIKLDFPELYAVAAMEIVVRDVQRGPSKMSVKINGKIAWVGMLSKWFKLPSEERSRFIVFFTDDKAVMQHITSLIRNKRLVDPIVLEMKRNVARSSPLVM